MLNIHDRKAAYEKTIGHETSKSTIYNLLARHGWRELMPRPFHPRRDIAAQNAFKKNGFPPSGAAQTCQCRPGRSIIKVDRPTRSLADREDPRTPRSP
jgi:hypothetical protein